METNAQPQQRQLAIITARGGSKRIVNKNIRLFDGKPIIAYSIRTALESDLFEHVVVTTDSEEIAAIAKDCGAEVPFMRDTALADDHTGTIAVVKDAIEQLRAQGASYNHTCCIYPTAPMLLMDDLAKGYQMLCDSDVDYVFSVGEYPTSVYRALQKNDDGAMVPLLSAYMQERSQDLPKAYCDAGQFYWGKSDAFVASKPIYGERSRGLVLPSSRVCDIDTEADWQQAEAMYQSLKESL